MNIVIVTTTRYRSITETRFTLAERMCTEAHTAGHATVIVDGSPEEDVAKRLSEAGALVYPELVHGMGPSRRQAFFFGSEAAIRLGYDMVLWIEAEKVQLIESIPEIIRPIEEGRADIIIPARSEKSWQTWPQFQQETEKQANAAYKEATGLNGFDPMHGPVAFHRSVAGYFMSFDPTRYSVKDRYIQHYAPLVALSDGKVVKSVTIETCYPPGQREEEEQNVALMLPKRQEQMEELSADYRTIACILKL